MMTHYLPQHLTSQEFQGLMAKMVRDIDDHHVFFSTEQKQ